MKKPQFMEGYDAGFTRDCERVLVTLLRGLGPLRSSIYLIGGLTPRYLVSAKPPDIPPHAGTGDLDLVIDMSILAGAEAYRTLEENLKHMGFERWVNDECIPVRWRWRTKTEGGRTVVIDFLTYDPLRADKRMVEVETAGEVTALNVPYADLVYALPRLISGPPVQSGGRFFCGFRSSIRRASRPQARQEWFGAAAALCRQDIGTIPSGGS